MEGVEAPSIPGPWGKQHGSFPSFQRCISTRNGEDEGTPELLEISFLK